MAFKVVLLFAACLAVAASQLIAPLAYRGDDGSYWPGKYDLRELHPALPSVRGAIAGLPAIAGWPHGRGIWW